MFERWIHEWTLRYDPKTQVEIEWTRKRSLRKFWVIRYR